MASYTQPLELASACLGSPLEMKIIQLLLQAPRSFEELLGKWTSSRKEMARSLYTLEERGVIERYPVSSYGLTDFGYSLQPIFRSIERCIAQHP